MSDETSPLRTFWQDAVNQLRRIVLDFPKKPIPVPLKRNVEHRLAALPDFSAWVVDEATRLNTKYTLVQDKLGEILAIIPELVTLMLEGELGKFDEYVSANNPFGEEPLALEIPKKRKGELGTAVLKWNGENYKTND